MNISVTGERMMINGSSERNQEDHLARYEFAQSFVAGKDVLDIACGTGYGCMMLASAGAKSVTGIDIDVEAIEFAKRNSSDSKINFLVGDAKKIHLPDKSIDTVVTFETIEHLEGETRFLYLEELKRVLRDDGVIILSTPNKLITSPWSEKPNNPFHVLEYYSSTLEIEITNHSLYISEWYGQRFVKKIFTKYPVYVCVRLIEKVFNLKFHIYDYADSSIVRKLPKDIEPRYFVVKIVKNI